MLAATPEDHRKLINAVHKRWKRAKSLKARANGRGPLGDDLQGATEGGDDSNMRLKGGYEAALYGDEDEEVLSLLAVRVQKYEY